MGYYPRFMNVLENTSLTCAVYLVCKYTFEDISIEYERISSKKLSVAQRVARYLLEII